MNEGIEFRPARPDDVERALPLLYSAGPAAYDYLFGTANADARAFLREAFERDAGFLGYRVFTVASVDGRLAGVGSFYSGAEMPRLTLSAFARVFAHYGILGGFEATRRLMNLAHLAPAPSRSTVLVTNLGVAPEMRGRGIASALLHHEMERARRSGKRKIALDVALDNPNAERLYTRLGLKVIKERLPPEDLASRVPGLRRMVLEL